MRKRGDKILCQGVKSIKKLMHSCTLPEEKGWKKEEVGVRGSYIQSYTELKYDKRGARWMLLIYISC